MFIYVHVTNMFSHNYKKMEAKKSTQSFLCIFRAHDIKAYALKTLNKNVQIIECV
jgi:hypothetical protein